MATVKQFEDLEVWQESITLTRDIYLMFKNCKDYGFKDQIQRSAVSIPSNISEGFERLTDKDAARFFSIAKGSAGELRTQIYLASLLNYIEHNEKMVFIERITSISKMLSGLIKYRLQ